MATAAPSIPTLSNVQRAWLKKLGAALEVPLGDVETAAIAPAPAKETKTGAKVTFRVTDKTSGAPVGKANVRLGNRTGQTNDADGVCLLDVEPGNTSFLIQKEGFQDATGKLDAKPGAQSDQPVQLDKEPAFNPPPESKQPTLRLGAKSADGWVEYLQKLLNKHLGPGTVPEDGTFDQKTHDAVKKFQGSTNPPCLMDGIVGNETWSMLRKGKREAVGVNKKGDEKGAEARWATEQNDFVSYDPGSDEMRMVAVSVGDSPIDKFKATFRIASQDQKVKKVFVRELGAPQGTSPTGAGHLHAVKVEQMSVIFGNGDHLVETFLDEELGGDLWSGTVKVAGPGPAPVPTAKTGKLNVLVIFSDDEQPAPKATLTFEPPPQPPAPEFELTDDDGRANVAGLTVGKCTITAKLNGALGKIDADIAEDKVASATISLARTGPQPEEPINPHKASKKDTPRKVIFAITDEAKAAIANARVKVQGLLGIDEDKKDTDLLDFSVPTDAKGRVQIFVTPRTYTIEVTANTFVKQTGHFTITDTPAKPFDIPLKKAEIPVTSIELKISPDRPHDTDQVVVLNATVTLRDKSITPVGEVLFDTRTTGTPLGRVKLSNGTASLRLPKLTRRNHFFRATFKPTPPVKGLEECETPFIEHVVFDRIEEQKMRALFTDLQPKIDEALSSALDFTNLVVPKLVPDRKKIVDDEAEWKKLIKGAQFDKAIKLTEETLKPEVEKYLVDAKAIAAGFAATGARLKTQLKNAKNKIEEAKKITKGLSDDDLKHLPLDLHNDLLEQLQTKPRSDDKLKAAKRLMSEKYLDPAFEKQNKANTRKLIAELKNDQELKTAREDWQKDRVGGERNEQDAIKRRLKILQKAVDAYARSFKADFDFPTVPVVPMKPSLSFPDKTKTVGEYDHQKKQILVNVHETALKQQSFDEALDTVIHEMAHRQQALMIDNLKPIPPATKAKIPPGHPLFDQAQSFKLNGPAHGGFYVRNGNPPPETKGPEYFTQPLENHSRITGDAIHKAGIGKV